MEIRQQKKQQMSTTHPNSDVRVRRTRGHKLIAKDAKILSRAKVWHREPRGPLYFPSWFEHPSPGPVCSASGLHRWLPPEDNPGWRHSQSSPWSGGPLTNDCPMWRDERPALLPQVWTNSEVNWPGALCCGSRLRLRPDQRAHLHLASPPSCPVPRVHGKTPFISHLYTNPHLGACFSGTRIYWNSQSWLQRMKTSASTLAHLEADIVNIEEVPFLS